MIIGAAPGSHPDGLFREKHGREIPSETYNYVFRVFSAAVICANPKLFGYDFDPPLGRSADAPAADSAK
jgi:hypothetical protein